MGVVRSGEGKRKKILDVSFASRGSTREETKKIKWLTWEPHHFDLPAQLDEPLLEELHLRRLAAAVEPLQNDQGPAGDDGSRLGLGFRGRRGQR